jgi:polynucleotide 5'-kinase involved in rRNA processing
MEVKAFRFGLKLLEMDNLDTVLLERNSNLYFRKLFNNKWYKVREIPREILMVVWNRYFEKPGFVEMRQVSDGWEFKKVGCNYNI